MLLVRELIAALESLPDSLKDAEVCTFDSATGMRTRFTHADLVVWRGRMELHGRQDENQR